MAIGKRVFSGLYAQTLAWPAFLGKFTVNVGMAAVGGAALSAANWTSTLTDTLRDKSPTEVRLMNLGLLNG